MVAQSDDRSKFSIQRIILHDMSYEAPNVPQIFQEEWDPEVNLEVSNKFTQLADNIHQVILSLTVTATLKEQVAFIVEVHMAGVFSIRDFPPAQLNELLGAYCPNIIYPYAREAVSDAVVRGGFPQLCLSPINFDAVYKQKKQQEQQAKAEETGSASH